MHFPRHLLPALLALVMSGSIAKPALAAGDDATAFVHSNLLHTLFHEAGHLVIDQFQLPVIGQEEDAADSFATFEILNSYDNHVDILMDAAEAMIVSHELAEATGEPFDYFGEHDLDIQRGLRIVCHAVGIDPERYDEAARWLDMAEERRITCEDEAIVAADSWETLLEDHFLPEGAEPSEVSVEIVEDADFETEIAFLKETGVLEDFAGWLSGTFRLPEPVEVVAEACGEENAFYDPSAVRITLCHEFIGAMFVLADER